MTTLLHRSRSNQGFTLIEMLIAIAITVVVMASVFQLLKRGQDSFQREPEVAEMTANARAGLDMISRDLNQAGFSTPARMSIGWYDGPGDTPDEVTIIFADPNVPTSEPSCPGGGVGCGTLESSASLFVKADAFEPPVTDTVALKNIYQEGQVLFAIETPGCDDETGTIDGETGMSIVPFTVTPGIAVTGKAPNLELKIPHGPAAGINQPRGFDGKVQEGCAIIGVFHVIQYRINPLPPADNPALERRDLGMPGQQDWTPVAANIENLQFQYSQGTGDVVLGTAPLFADLPGNLPKSDNPNTWITGVRVSVYGRSESTNLAGGTAGVFAAEDTHMRRTFTSSAILRNQLGHAADWAEENPEAWTALNVGTAWQ